MNDHRSRISSHPDFDDSRHWQFARTYPHPIDSGRHKWWTPDGIVFGFCLALLVALVVAHKFGYI